MPNMALDLLGQSRALYSYAAALENKGRSEDDFAYLRTDREYTNCLLVERPNTDFAHTMLKQFYFAAFMHPFWQGIANGTDTTLNGIAAKAEKEIAYHIRHAGEWIIRLGDGTDESATRMQNAVEALHSYTSELSRNSIPSNRWPQWTAHGGLWFSFGRSSVHATRLPGSILVVDTPDLEHARQIAAAIPDPELPYLTLTDLGILRSVEIDKGTVVARVSPTYSGCPALDVIEQSVLDALLQAGFKARVERSMSPPWTTDWITEDGHRKLKENGIAPPRSAATDKVTLFAKRQLACPACDSTATERVSEFGSTPCKAQYRCMQCLEPFEYFKCH